MVLLFLRRSLRRNSKEQTVPRFIYCAQGIVQRIRVTFYIRTINTSGITLNALLAYPTNVIIWSRGTGFSFRRYSLLICIKFTWKNKKKKLIFALLRYLVTYVKINNFPDKKGHNSATRIIRQYRRHKNLSPTLSFQFSTHGRLTFGNSALAYFDSTSPASSTSASTFVCRNN